MSSLDPLHPMKLSNGLTISITDRSRIYFGDYYLVRLEISCSLNATFSGSGQICDAGNEPIKIAFKRVLERMGVPSAAVDSVKKTLLADFEKNSVPYLASPAFPQKMIAKELSAKKTPGRKFIKAAA